MPSHTTRNLYPHLKVTTRNLYPEVRITTKVPDTIVAQIITAVTPLAFGVLDSDTQPQAVFTSGTYQSTAGTIDSVTTTYIVNNQPVDGTTPLAVGTSVTARQLVVDSAGNEQSFVSQSRVVVQPTAALVAGVLQPLSATRTVGGIAQLTLSASGGVAPYTYLNQSIGTISGNVLSIPLDNELDTTVTFTVNDSSGRTAQGSVEVDISVPVTPLMQMIEAAPEPMRYFLPDDAGATWTSRQNAAAVTAGLEPWVLTREGNPTLLNGRIINSVGNGYAGTNLQQMGGTSAFSFFMDVADPDGVDDPVAYLGSADAGPSSITKLVFRSGPKWAWNTNGSNNAHTFIGMQNSGLVHSIEWTRPGGTSNTSQVKAYENGVALADKNATNTSAISSSGNTLVLGGSRTGTANAFRNVTIGVVAFSAGVEMSANTRAALNAAVREEHKIHGVAITGQSNAVGQGADDGGQPYPANTFQLTRGSGAADRNIAPAVDPLDNFDAQAGTMGLVRQFAIELAASDPKASIVILPNAKPSTSYAEGNWGVGNPFSLDHIARSTFFYNKFPNAKRTVTLHHQGEGDSGNANYASQLDADFAEWRAQIPGAANMPIILGELKASFVANNANSVNDIIKDTPNRVPYTAVASSVVPFVLNGPDSVHFSGPDLRELGSRYYAKLSDARSNSVVSSALNPMAATRLVAYGASLTQRTTNSAQKQTRINKVMSDLGYAAAALDNRAQGGESWADLKVIWDDTVAATISAAEKGTTAAILVPNGNDVTEARNAGFVYSTDPRAGAFAGPILDSPLAVDFKTLHATVAASVGNIIRTGMTTRFYPTAPAVDPFNYEATKQNGSFPYAENIVNPLIAELAPAWNAGGNPVVDTQTFTRNNQAVLVPNDGIHFMQHMDHEFMEYILSEIKRALVSTKASQAALAGRKVMFFQKGETRSFAYPTTRNPIRMANPSLNDMAGNFVPHLGVYQTGGSKLNEGGYATDYQNRVPDTDFRVTELVQDLNFAALAGNLTTGDRSTYIEKTFFGMEPGVTGTVKMAAARQGQSNATIGRSGNIFINGVQVGVLDAALNAPSNTAGPFNFTADAKGEVKIRIVPVSDIHFAYDSATRLTFT